MKVSRRRVIFQIFLHLVLIGHVLAYYLLDLRAIGALDFQSFFHNLLGEGLLTAGALLTLIVYGSALVFGRLFCSWGCHFGATQDFCAWLLRKARVRLPFVRTRFLHWFSVLFLVLIFVAPLLADWPRRDWRLSVDFSAVGPWDTLPGWVLSITTLLTCGAGILLFLGTRGFCRFVCPYGALFRFTDKFAPYRVRKVKACGGSCAASSVDSGAGSELNQRPSPIVVPPCTVACPTAIDVHGETSATGAVTSADCVRCHLCIEACPQEALAYRARPTEPARISHKFLLRRRKSRRGRRRASRLDPQCGGTTPPVETLDLLATPRPAASRDETCEKCGPVGVDDSGRRQVSSEAPEASRPSSGATLPFWAEVTVAVVTVVTYFLIDLVYGGHFLAASLALGEGILVYAAVAALRGGPGAVVFGRPLRRARGWTFSGVTACGLVLLSAVPLFQAGAFKWFYYKGLWADPGVRGALVVTGSPPSPDRDLSLRQAADFYRRALECFPRHPEVRQLLLSAYTRLDDPRAVAQAEELYLYKIEDDTTALETLRTVYLRFGQLQKAAGLPAKETP